MGKWGASLQGRGYGNLHRSLQSIPSYRGLCFFLHSHMRIVFCILMQALALYLILFFTAKRKEEMKTLWQMESYRTPMYTSTEEQPTWTTCHHHSPVTDKWMMVLPLPPFATAVAEAGNDSAEDQDLNFNPGQVYLRVSPNSCYRTLVEIRKISDGSGERTI